MADHRKSRRRSHGGDHDEGEHENDERWLLTYADMITLLMCLFMVLFSISSVNTSKWDSLQRALKDAFSGSVLSGGKAVMQSGDQSEKQPPAPSPQSPSLMPIAPPGERGPNNTKESAADAKAEAEDFRRLKRRVDRTTKAVGLSKSVKTEIKDKGLVIKLLTDQVFFDSGEAVLKEQGAMLVSKLAHIIQAEQKHSVSVEGYTDSRPIRSHQFPSNWELSGARAGSVVRTLSGSGVGMRRLSLSGFADLHPVATNSTDSGRAANRRVEIVLTRLYSRPTTNLG